MKKFTIIKNRSAYGLMSFLWSFFFAAGILVSAQNNSYIYLHQKSIGEATSTDITYTITGAGGYSKTVTLNDKDYDRVRVGDISADTGGNLYATAWDKWSDIYGWRKPTNIYIRDAEQSQWINTGKTAADVVGGIYNYGGNGVHGYYYSVGTKIYYVEGATEYLIYSVSGLPEWDPATRIRDLAWSPYGGNRGSLYFALANDSWGGSAYDILRLSNTGAPNAWSTSTIVSGVTGGGRVRIAADADGTVYYSDGNGDPEYVYKKAVGASAVNLWYPTSATMTSGSRVIRDMTVNSKGELFVSWNDLYTYKYNGSWGNREEKSRGILALGSNPAALSGQIWGVYTSWNVDGYNDYFSIWSRAENSNEIWWVDDERVRTSNPGNTQGALFQVPPGAILITANDPSGYNTVNINLFDPSGDSSSNVGNNEALLMVDENEIVHAEFEIWHIQSTELQYSCTESFIEDFGTGSIGNFGAPVTGVTSYHYKGDSETAEDGYYKIVTRTNPDFAGWPISAFDHTSGNGTGQMMVINAAYNKEEFYRRRFTNAVEGATYNFSTWILNINNEIESISPNVTIQIRDAETGTVLNSANTGDIPKDQTWHQYGFSFTAPANDFDVILINNSIGGDGNDLAIDDITFNMDMPTPQVSYSFNCVGEGPNGTGFLTITFPLSPPGTELYEYSIDNVNWQTSTMFSLIEGGNYNIYLRYKNSPDGICGFTPANITVNCTDPDLKGSIFNDGDGPSTIDGTATNGDGLFVNVIDDVTGNVIYVAVVNADGTFSVPAGKLENGKDYTLQLNKHSGIVGQNAPVVELNYGWTTVGENFGTPGNDGVHDSTLHLTFGTTANLDDVRFGIYSDNESKCGMPVPGDAFGWYEGSPVGSEITHSFTQPGTNAGFTMDINYLDNSFNMIINGTPLATAELEFQSNSTPGINIEFEDGTQYQTNTPAIWQMNKAYADDPLLDPHDAPVVIRVIISPAGEVSMFGWKGDAGDMTLYPLKLKTGPGTYEPATFNTIPWNQTSTNEITVSQRVISVTSMYGTGYGMNYAPCDCEKPSIATGDVLDTKVGISALGRDAMDRTENNWPEVRKGGWIALESHTKGFVPNRLSDAERDTIPSADLRSGMMIYNTDSDCIQINVDGTATGWHCFNEPGCPDVIRL